MKLLPAALLVAVLAVAGCGGGGDDTPEPPVVVEPTAYEAAKMAIETAETAEAAQMAYEAALDDVSGTEASQLMTALDNRKAELATMAREAFQKEALMTAAAAIDTSDLGTRDAVSEANMAINGLEAALNNAEDVSDADKATYMTQLETARGAVATAVAALDTMDRQAMQREAIETALEDARTKVRMVNDMSDDDEVSAADMALDMLQMAIDGAADLPEGDDQVAGAMASHEELGTELANAKTSRTAYLDKVEDDQRKANEAAAAAMAVTAKKLHAGISTPTATDANTADTDTATGTRFAGYVTTAGTPAGASVGDIVVGISDDDDVALSEDKDTMVRALSGWEGKRYHRTTPAADGTYEAHVFSHIEATMGKKFGGATADDEFQYALTSGMLAVDTSSTTAYVDLVGGSQFNHEAGVKRFPLSSPNPTGETIRTIPGSFHGVSGTYSCTPGTTAVCAVNVSGDGFELGTVPSATDATFTDGGGAWMFRPSDPNARVTDAGDSSYASYGWWLHKSADDNTYTASAFVARRGAASAASGLNSLNGKATYVGGAAGKYALSSATGGTNDAGHFRARATLEADFTTASGDTVENAITGTIDQFVDGDGDSKNWSVKLNGSPITDTGTIGGAAIQTEWTIDGTPADDAGSWTGSLQENDNSGVPAIATGTFYSTYGTAGSLVGAFGANKQ
ncbi:MAG: hypothetical protein F4109_01485 [Gammaproteobacteria bacterium]|nr:hypothetical protein [Gammaproteobacteria bacterium]